MADFSPWVTTRKEELQAIAIERIKVAFKRARFFRRCRQRSGQYPWTTLQRWMDRPGITSGLGAVALHSKEARDEAVRKLVSNHARVLRDVVHPSSTSNIENKPLTQLALRRIHPRERDAVDEFLREVAFRLLGERPAFATFVRIPSVHEMP